MIKIKGGNLEKEKKKGRFHIQTSRFCPRTLAVAQRLRKYFADNGWTEEKVSKADLIVIFGCEFSAEEQDYAHRQVRNLDKKVKEGAKIIITGCLPSVRGQLFKGRENIVSIGLEELDNFDYLIKATQPIHSIQIPNILPEDLYQYTNYGSRMSGLKYFIHLARKKRLRQFRDWTISRLIYRTLTFQSYDYHRKFYILLSTGCSGVCSYCSERLVFRGYESRPEGIILEEFRNGLKLGFKKFVLEAFDTGLYGTDTGSDLISLLKRFHKISDGHDINIEILNLNPKYFVENACEFMGLLQDGQRIAWLQVPIQSGSNRILELMGRQYKIGKVIETMQTMKQKFPRVGIETHFIVGFPGETGSDFLESLRCLDEVDFAKVSIFMYEKKEGTPAATMPGQITDNLKRSRYREMWWRAFLMKMKKGAGRKLRGAVQKPNSSNECTKNIQ